MSNYHITVQCGKMKNLLSPKRNSSNQLFSIFSSKNVTFTKFLSEKCDSNTLWKFLNFAATVFSQKLRQINVLRVLLKNITINWFDGKNLHGREFLVFPHCVFQWISLIQGFSSITFKTVDFTNALFLKREERVRISYNFSKL